MRPPILMNEQQYANAMGVLKEAAHVAKTPEQVATVEARMEQIELYNSTIQARTEKVEQHDAAVERTRQTEKGTGSIIVTDTRTMTITSSDGRKFVIRPDSAQQTPGYPTEAPTGLVTRREAYCAVCTVSIQPSLPSESTRTGKAPAVSLYRNDFNQIDFSATNFAPKSDLNPCTDIEGLKAKVAYAEVSDKTVAGQILSVELTK